MLENLQSFEFSLNLQIIDCLLDGSEVTSFVNILEIHSVYKCRRNYLLAKAPYKM